MVSPEQLNQANQETLDFTTCPMELFFRIPQEKRERIINIAIGEFAQYGFAHANVNKIAEAAGVSIGALYKYFPTKDALFLYAVEVVAQGIQSRINEIVDSDIRFLSKLEKLLRISQISSQESSAYVKLYNVFASDNDVERSAILTKRVESIGSKAYYKMIAQAQEKGEIRSDIDASLLAFMLDNQLMMTQFSFACEYYKNRFSMYLGKADSSDEEYVINNIMKALESLFQVKD